MKRIKKAQQRSKLRKRQQDRARAKKIAEAVHLLRNDTFQKLTAADTILRGSTYYVLGNYAHPYDSAKHAQPFRAAVGIAHSNFFTGDLMIVEK